MQCSKMSDTVENQLNFSHTNQFFRASARGYGSSVSICPVKTQDGLIYTVCLLRPERAEFLRTIYVLNEEGSIIHTFETNMRFMQMLDAERLLFVSQTSISSYILITTLTGDIIEKLIELPAVQDISVRINPDLDVIVWKQLQGDVIKYAEYIDSKYWVKEIQTFEPGFYRSIKPWSQIIDCSGKRILLSGNFRDVKGVVGDDPFETHLYVFDTESGVLGRIADRICRGVFYQDDYITIPFNRECLHLVNNDSCLFNLRDSNSIGYIPDSLEDVCIFDDRGVFIGYSSESRSLIATVFSISM